MRAFVINLARCSERRRKVIAAFHEIGIELEVFNAIDGTQKIEFEAGESVNYLDERTRPNGYVDSTQVGCYLSHYRLLRDAYREGLERVLVVEDDIRPLPGFRDALDEISRLPDSFELIKLYCPHHRRLVPGFVPRGPVGRVAHRLHDGKRIVRLRGMVYGMLAYVINRAGMKKFLDCAQPVCAPVDVLWAYFWRMDLASYVVLESLVEDCGEATTIHVPGRHYFFREATNALNGIHRKREKFPRLRQRLWHFRDWLTYHAYIRRRRGEFYD